jgi:phage portal protein BeeE
MMMGHLALRGTGYNRIVTDGRGEVAELIPMHPDRMKVEALDDRGRYRYKYKQADGSEEILPPAPSSRSWASRRTATPA